MNLCTKQKQIHIENRLRVTKGRGVREEWEFGISRSKLLYIQQGNKVLLYNTGHYIQYSVINHNGKEYEKKYTYVYVYIYI